MDNPSEFYSPVASDTERVGLTGTWLRFWFPNGFGASVICHKYSYGGESGLWEIAVLHRTHEGDKDGDICYASEVTGDVIGHVAAHEVDSYLHQIADLVSSPACDHQTKR